MFVTEFLGILTISTGELVFSNGGHNIPYLRKQNGKWRPAEGARVALGVMEDFEYFCASVQLEAGDSVVLYTDGSQRPGILLENFA